ncbi:MAG: peptide chain release factor N(5)-glutamine methyltransferase [Hyphomonadaceae bacterium]|nr:peptide chain release factor N(5)-glutamine methyltransferase [Hyphomonadaceae bacterium]
MSQPTYSAALSSGTKQLIEAGLEEAALKAKLLLMNAAESDATDLILRAEEPVSDSAYRQYERFIEQAAAHKPIQHIIGEAAFFDFTLRVDSRALIPRPDSECVVELALRRLPDDHEIMIVDLGTGTGALLLAILQARPRACGIGVEQSEAAAQLADLNRKRVLERPDRMSVFHGSWADWRGWAQCDLIVSNPPYIRSDVIPTLAPEVRDYEPAEALDGGADGLTAYREIIALAANTMKSGAHLVFEIGFDQKQAVSELLIEAGFTDLEHKRDLGGNDRAIAATKS